MNLEGTRLCGRGSPAEVDRALADLLERGARHARRQRIGCGLVTVGLVTAILLFVLGHWNAMTLVGLGIVAIYFYASSLDPELEDDRRVRVVRALLDQLELDDVAPVNVDLELNAPDAEDPDECEPLNGGRERRHYAQRWLELGALLASGERVTLMVAVELNQVEDGIQITEMHQQEFASVDVEVDGTAIEREVPPPPPWQTDGTRFQLDALAEVAHLEALVLAHVVT